MKKLRLREVISLVQTPKASEGQSWDSNLDSWASESVLLTTFSTYSVGLK